MVEILGWAIPSITIITPGSVAISKAYEPTPLILKFILDFPSPATTKSGETKDNPSILLALADCSPSPLIAVTAAAVSITVDSDLVAVTTSSSNVA